LFDFFFVIFLLNKNSDYENLFNLLVHFTPINTLFGLGWFKTPCGKFVTTFHFQDIHRDCSILTIKH